MGVNDGSLLADLLIDVLFQGFSVAWHRSALITSTGWSVAMVVPMVVLC